MDDEKFVGPPPVPGNCSVDQRLAALEAEVALMRRQMLTVDHASAAAEWATNSATTTRNKLDQLLEHLENIRDETGLRVDRLAIKGVSYMKKIDKIEERQARFWDRVQTVVAVFFCLFIFLYWLSTR